MFHQFADVNDALGSGWVDPRGLKGQRSVQQAKHHQKMTFQDESRRLLERYQVAFDERYV